MVAALFAVLQSWATARDLETVRAGMAADLEAVRADLSADFAEVRGELRATAETVIAHVNAPRGYMGRIEGWWRRQRDYWAPGQAIIPVTAPGEWGATRSPPSWFTCNARRGRGFRVRGGRSATSARQATGCYTDVHRYP